MKVLSRVQVFGLQYALNVAGYPMYNKIPETFDAIETTLNRGKRLGSTNIGEGHDNFLCGIVVQFDLSCTNKMWMEFQRYHFADIISSQSLMHKIKSMDFEFRGVNEDIKNLFLQLRDKYIAKGDKATKEDYIELLMSAPNGIVMTAGVTTNYRQLKTIYNQRKNHRLPEWRAFCQQLLELPYFKELCLNNEV